MLETLRQVLEESGGQQVERVFSVVELLAKDTEPSVRAELMEQVSLQTSPDQILRSYS